MTLVIIYAVMYCWALIASALEAARLSAFLEGTRSINHVEALVKYKSLARIGMYMALQQMVVLIAGGILGILLIMRHGMLGLVGVLVANAAVLIAGRAVRGLEQRVRSLPTSEDLSYEYKRVSESWVKKPFPDF